MLTRDGVRRWARVAACVFALGLTIAAAQDIASPAPGTWRLHDATVTRQHVDGTRTTHAFGETVVALAAADGTLFVATSRGIWSGDAVGTAPRRLWSSSGDAPPIVALHLDAARGFLWIVRERDVLRFDVLDGFRESLRVAVGERVGSALDQEQGTLWLLGEAALTALDGDGHVVDVIDVPVEVARSATLVRIEPPSRARLDTPGGAVMVDLATGRAEAAPTAAEGADPGASFAPVLEVISRPHDGQPSVDLALHASCGAVACGDDTRYVAHTVASAAIDGVDVAARLTATANGAWRLTVTTDEVQRDARVHVVAMDAYGNRATRDIAAGSLRRDASKTNALPTIRITAPSTGATAVAPATMTIAATAADTDGTIAKVEFYRNGVLLGTDAASPYTWAWSGVAAGSYTLTAKAYDNAGGTALSAPVSVVVKANVPPSITLVSPPTGAGFVAPATITLSASASDTDGTIAKVDFLRGGTTAIATVKASPYTYTWTNVPAGTYSLTARATDDKGATTTSAAVTAKVNNPPSVSVTSPLNGARIVAPASVTLKASAADTDGTIAKVEFLGDGVLLGTDTSSPYSVVWTTPALGSHTVIARATDNLGAVKSSVAVPFTVDVNQAPAVTLTAPATGAQLYAGTAVTLAATASDPDANLARVEFFFGASLVAVDSTAPYAATVTVPAGVTTITAVAVDSLGLRASSAPVAITGVVNAVPVVTLDSPLDGEGFLSATVADIPLSASARDPDGAIVRVRLMAAPYFAFDDSEGAPIVVATLTSPPYAATWRGVAPAVDPVFGYRVWAEADDDAGATTQSAHALVQVSNGSPWLATIVEPAADTSVELDAPATVVVAGRVTYGYTNPGADPVQRVELLADGGVVGSLAAPNGAAGEHVFVWRNAGVGARRLQLRVVDTLGLVSASDPVTVNVVAPDQPPLVTLAAPVTNQLFVGTVNGATVPISVGASDPDGAVTRLAAVTEGAFVASVAPPSAQVTWSGVLPGVHVVTGRATDDRGREAESPPAFIRVVNSPPPPVVAITAPAPGGAHVPRQPITITSEAGGPDPVARVDYMTVENGNLVGSSTAPPYAVVWTPAPGPITLRAIAYSVNGRSTASVDVPVNVLTNLPPTAQLTAPRNGAQFTAGEVVRLDAIAGDSDGSVAAVAFAANGAVFSTDATDPYAATWTAPSPGAYALTATATDNQGASAISTPVNVGVVAAVAAVTITSPAGGASIASGNPAPITVRTVLPGKLIARVEYFLDGAWLGGVVPTGVTTVATTTYNWAQPLAGTHVLTARGVATDGTSLASSPVTVVVDDYSMALADPVPGQVFVLPAEIRIQAAPTATGVTIARVEFLGDGAVIGTQAAPPYAMVWRGAGTGSHTVGARAIDATGRIVSATVPVRVASAPDVTVTPGVDNGTLADDVAIVTGVVTAPRNAAVMVEGRQASVDPAGNFRVEGIPLVPGANVLTVTVNTADAPPLKRTLTINSTGSAPFSVELSPQDGFAPLVGTLTIRNRAQVPFGRIEVDAGDNGTVDATLTALVDGEARVPYTVTGAGTFVVKVTVYDAASRVIYQARRQMRVFDRAELAGKVLGAYTTMVERLAVSDASAALRLFTGDAQPRYADIFATLGGDLPAAAADLRRLVDGVIGDDIAELTISRDTPAGPMLFMVYLVRGRDGVWRIESL